MTEFNLRVDRGIADVAKQLTVYQGLAIRTIIGRKEKIEEFVRYANSSLEEALVYSSEDIPDLKARRVYNTTIKNKKYPIDLVVCFSDDSYFIVRGKCIFGAIGDYDGYSLAKRVTRGVVRIFHA